MQVDWNFDFPFIVTPIAKEGGFILEVLNNDGEVVFIGSYGSMERIGQELDFWKRNNLFNTKGHLTEENADKL